MDQPYAGPFRAGPLAVELANTRYAHDGEPVDALASAAQARAWLRLALARLPDAGLPTGRLPSPTELAELRDAVRAVLEAAVADRAPDRAAIATLNAAAAAAPTAAHALRQPDGTLRRTTGWGAATRAEAVLALLATDALDVVTGPARSDLGACGAPGCVLLYLRAHPRRAWCSNACGNRARQARHYARTHPRP